MKSIPGLALILFLAAAAPSHAQDAARPEDVIIHVMMATFDKPDLHLQVSPVAVEGDYAVAGWTQGEMGGRALLKLKGHDWTIHLCAGDGLKSAEFLKNVGMSADAAAHLAARLAELEAKEPAARITQFATFDGVVMIGADGHHPPAAGGEHKHPAN
jgi:hypothetical protein